MHSIPYFGDDTARRLLLLLIDESQQAGICKFLLCRIIGLSYAIGI
jgi:hypothetical protein